MNTRLDNLIAAQTNTQIGEAIQALELTIQCDEGVTLYAGLIDIEAFRALDDIQTIQYLIHKITAYREATQQQASNMTEKLIDLLVKRRQKIQQSRVPEIQPVIEEAPQVAEEISQERRDYQTFTNKLLNGLANGISILEKKKEELEKQDSLSDAKPHTRQIKALENAITTVTTEHTNIKTMVNNGEPITGLYLKTARENINDQVQLCVTELNTERSFVSRLKSWASDVFKIILGKDNLSTAKTLLNTGSTLFRFIGIAAKRSTPPKQEENAYANANVIIR